MRRFIASVPGKLITAFYSSKDWGKKSEEERQVVTDKIRAAFDTIES